MIPLQILNTYRSLTEEQKEEIKRTGVGIGSQVVREGLELSRLITQPEPEEIEETEKFLENLYNYTVGPESVERVQRGEKEVVQIKEPETFAGQFIRDAGSFGVSLLGVGKVTKPLQAIKAVEKVKKVAPKTTAITGAVVRGETAAQLSLNPYEENFANFLGDMIDDDSESFYSDIEKYLLEPIKSSQEKTELENRIALLAEGLGFTGIFGLAELGIRNRDQISKAVLGSLQNIKNKGTDVSQAFVNKMRRLNEQDKDFQKIALDKRQADAIKNQKDKDLLDIVEGKSNVPSEVDLGDIEALKNEKVLGLRKFSTISPIRFIANGLAKTFTSKGGRSELLHERYLQTQNAKDKWDATIDHVARNFEKSINDIHKSIGGDKEELLSKLNKILFSDFRLPTLLTRKGVSLGKSQQQGFDEALKEFPEAARKPIIAARNLQDQLSKLLLKSENVSAADKKIIQEQLGFYVRESYKLFEDSLYMPSIQATNAARRFIKADIKKRNPNISKEELKLQTQAEMEILAGGQGKFTEFTSGFETFSKLKEGILVDKQEIPIPIKNYLGEITDPVEKLTLSMRKIAQFVEDSNFHNQAYKDGKDIYFHTKKNAIPGFNVKIPEIKDAKVQPYGPLSGMYTTKDLAQYYTKVHQQGLSKFGEQLPVGLKELWQGAIFLKSQAQKSATTRRLSTQIKNIVGGFQMTGANGFRNLNSKIFSEGMTTVYSQLTRGTDLEKQKFIEELAGQGIINKSAVLGDLQNMAKDAANVSFLKEGFLAKPIGNAARKISKLPAIKQTLELDNFTTELYMAGDNLFKTALYANEKKFLKEFSDSLPKDEKFNKFRYDDIQLQNEAGRQVRNGLPNYDLVPDNLKELRGIPAIGTFFSFLSESARLAVTIPRQIAKEFKISRDVRKLGATKAADMMRSRALDRAVGFTVFAVGGSAVVGTNVVNYGSGVTQDTIDNIKEFAPSYMQNDNLVYSVNEDGVPVIYNLTPWDAFDFPRKPFQTMLHKAMNQDLTEEELQQYEYDVWEEMFSPFFGESLTQEVFNSYLLRNGTTPEGSKMKNPYDKTGLEIFDENKEDGKLNPDNLKILFMNLVETIEPGTLRDTRKYFTETFGKEYTRLNQKIYQDEAMFKWLTGFGGLPMNKEYVETLYEFKIRDFKKLKSQRNGQIYAAITDTMDKDTFINNWLNANQNYYNDWRAIHKSSEAADALGVNVLNILKENNVSKLDRANLGFGLTNRYFRPLDLTEEMKQSILESESLKKDYFTILLEIQELSKKLSELPVLVSPESDIEIKTKDEREEIFESLRVPKSKGGLVKGPEVPYTEEDPADRVNPYTGESYSGKTELEKQMEELI